jgi:hypothetical protein
MAGTAIAVALVPPVCVMGLMLAAGDYADARGAGLLYRRQSAGHFDRRDLGAGHP